MSIIFKAVFVLLLAWILYRHTRLNPEGLNWSLLFSGSRLREHGHWLLLAAVLVPVNWAAETLKWQCFLRAYSQVSFLRAFAAVLSGVSVSLFTPNRIGEYGGRILALDAGAAWGAAISTVLGSLCQWVALLAGGAIGAYVIAAQFTDTAPFILRSFLMLGLGLSAVLAFALFNVGLAAGAARKIPWRKPRLWWMRRLAALRRYDNRSIAAALGWAALRYGVYCLQYYLLLRFFGIQVPAGMAAAGIAAIFLAQTSIPLPPLAGLLARGELALAVWGQFTAETAGILAAAYGLFILNLSLPSLVGAMIILRSNLNKFWRHEPKTLENHTLGTPSDHMDGL